MVDVIHLICVGEMVEVVVCANNAIDLIFSL
jgi:hypothetical protein